MQFTTRHWKAAPVYPNRRFYFARNRHRRHGHMTGGRLHREQKIVIQPGQPQARIRSIQSHGRELEVAEPGMRTAINLPDVTPSRSAGEMLSRLPISLRRLRH